MCRGDEIQVADLPSTIIRWEQRADGSGLSLPPKLSEKEQIENVLRRNLGNRGRAAHELGMHRTTLWRKMKTYGIGEPPD